MADESNKLIIEVDADTSSFKVKMGDLTQTLKTAGSSGDSAFRSMGEATVIWNQGLEFANKILEGISSTLETISKSESFSNQEIGLKALGSQVGLTEDQLKKLRDVIKEASGGTVKDMEAMTIASRLLYENVSTKNIPTLVEFAERLHTLHPEFGSIVEIVNRFSEAIERGSTRGIMPFVNGIKDTNDRLETQNALLQSASKYLRETEGDYSHAGEALKTKLSDKWDEFQRVLGTAWKPLAVDAIGTEAQKAQVRLDALKKELEALQTMQPPKAFSFLGMPGSELGAEFEREKAERKKTLLSEINKEQEKLTFNVTAEAQAREKAVEAVGEQTKKILKPVDIETQNKIKIQNTAEMYSKLRQDHEAYADDTLNIDKNYEQSQRALIEREYQEELKRLRNTAMTTAQYLRQELQAEDTKYKHLADLNAKLHRDNELTKNNVVHGWMAGIDTLKNEWQSWSKITERVTIQTQSVMSSSIIKMAKDHKFAMNEMLNNFFEMIGETLIQKGTADILMSIFPPNPGGAAAGAAEIALGAALVGTAGGSSSPSAGGGSSTDLGGGSLSQPSSSQMQQKHASIIINGDFLNSQETVNHLQELIRKNSDVTDYTITAQGKQY